MGDILVSEASNEGLTEAARIYNTKEDANKMNKLNRIYAITYDAQGWEQRTEIGTATSKGIAYIFAESVLSIYKTVRIVYADGTGTLIGMRPNTHTIYITAIRTLYSGRKQEQMSKLTREQVIKFNQGIENGFQFDISYYVFHGEKTVRKDIEIDADHVITVHLIYKKEFISKSNSYGCNYAVESGNVIPTAHFAKALVQRGMLISNGLGYWHELGPATSKKNYNDLRKFTEDLTDAKCLEIFEALTKTQVNQYA